MIRAIRHTGIVVADLEVSLRFWCDVMGFQLLKRMDETGEYLETLLATKGATVTTAKLAAPDGNLIELLHFSSHPDKPAWVGTPYSTGLTHIALTVSDLEATLGRLTGEGINSFAKPQISPDGRVKVVYCSGPENLLLELVENLSD